MTDDLKNKREENKGRLLGVAAFIGALLFRIRGGLWDIWENKIWYPIFVGLLYWLVAYETYIGDSWCYFVLGFVAAYTAQQMCGWGAYRGALVAGAAPAEEVAVIDWLLSKSQWLLSHPRWWGFAGCSLRGFMSSILFGLLSQSLIVGLSGLAVGLCYGVPTLALWYTRWHNTKAAWNIGEYFEGALYSVVILYYSNL